MATTKGGTLEQTEFPDDAGPNLKRGAQAKDKDELDGGPRLSPGGPARGPALKGHADGAEFRSPFRHLPRPADGLAMEAPDFVEPPTAIGGSGRPGLRPVVVPELIVDVDHRGRDDGPSLPGATSQSQTEGRRWRLASLRPLGVLLGLWLLAGSSREAVAQAQDLRNTNGGRELLKVLKSLAQGNERSAGIDSLTADLRSGKVSGSVWIRHRQKSAEVGGTAGDLLRRANVSREVIAYDLTMRGNFAFNPKQGTGHLTLDLGRGVKFDTKNVERLLEGDLSAVADAYPTLGFLEQRLWNDYDTIRPDIRRAAWPRECLCRVERFVDWATPETAGRWVLTAIATAGTSGGRIRAPREPEHVDERGRGDRRLAPAERRPRIHGRRSFDPLRRTG